MSSELTTQKEQAAALIATDTQTDREIARTVGVDVRTIARWKKQDAFSARVADLRTRLARRVADSSLMEKEGRLRLLNDIVDRMLGTMEDRAADRGVLEPGYKRGLMQKGTIPSGRLETYEMDGTLLKEIREYNKQIAQERGQWTEKKEHSGTVQLDLAERLEKLLDMPVEIRYRPENGG